MEDSQLRLPAYGGQALIEGVLMRGAHAVAAAMRAPDGNIIIHTEQLTGIYRAGWARLPFVRGLVGLWDALGLGTRFLMMSAELQGDETPPDQTKTPPTLTTLLTLSLGVVLNEGSSLLTVGFSLLITVLLFFVLPAVIAQYVSQWLGWNSWWSNLLEGLIRLAGIIAYMWGVGRMPEIQRVFAYHGAEHQTINAYEARQELTIENVMSQSLEHPRCGTAFLLTMVVLSIFVYTLLGPMPGIWRILSRVILIPVLAGMAYELIRWTANHRDLLLARWLMKPNLALQTLTTRRPPADVVEVAIASFQAMIEKEAVFNPALPAD